MMDHDLVVGLGLFSVILIFTAAAYAVFITYWILKKYNDIGDSSCDINEYSPKGIGYDRMIDDAPETEKRLLMNAYGESPYDDSKISIPEVLLKNAKDG